LRNSAAARASASTIRASASALSLSRSADLAQIVDRRIDQPRDSGMGTVPCVPLVGSRMSRKPLGNAAQSVEDVIKEIAVLLEIGAAVGPAMCSDVSLSQLA
jgi:hypothetical protein